MPLISRTLLTGHPSSEGRSQSFPPGESHFWSCRENKCDCALKKRRRVCGSAPCPQGRGLLGLFGTPASTGGRLAPGCLWLLDQRQGSRQGFPGSSGVNAACNQGNAAPPLPCVAPLAAGQGASRMLGKRRVARSDFPELSRLPVLASTRGALCPRGTPARKWKEWDPQEQPPARITLGKLPLCLVPYLLQRT